MSSDPAFLFYPGDYLRDTQCLSESAQTAYDRIMCEHMRNICITQQQLNFFTKRLTPDQKSEVMAVLKKVVGGFQIGWVAESIEKRRNYSDSRRKNREGKHKSDNNISKSYVPHMEIGIENENGVVLENKELISKNEILDEQLEDWQRWGDLIVKEGDQYWEQMHGRKVTQDEMDAFLSVATRNKWKMTSGQEFRVSLKGFNWKKNTTTNGARTNTNSAELITTDKKYRGKL